MAKNKLTLVVLAAGIGSRYGGLKQLESVGPYQELLIDYSFYDAWRSGFDKIVCVIRPEIEQAFCEKISNRWKAFIDIKHVYQKFPQTQKRKKPWGTAHAILAAKSAIDTPFMAINADDFYGRTSFKLLADFLVDLNTKKSQYAMVGFHLKNTLSEYGHVSRGICEIKDRFLFKIEEKQKVMAKENQIVYCHEENWLPLPKDSLVSMNCWGFTPGVFDFLQKGFDIFSKNNQNLKAEYAIPTVVDELISNKQISVTVLASQEKWMGITYQEDKNLVQENILNLISTNIYPKNLLQAVQQEVNK